MSTKGTSKYWLLASMSRGARRTAMVLSGLTLTVTLAFAGTLYAVESSTVPSRIAPNTMALAQAAPTHDGAELIVDDAVPLAAPEKQAGTPTALLLGCALAVAGGFFATRIHQVDANISTMYHKVS